MKISNMVHTIIFYRLALVSTQVTIFQQVLPFRSRGTQSTLEVNLMTINAQNKEIINTRNVHIHDDVLVNFDIDIISKSICLTFRSWEKEQCYTITFQNVIAFSSTCCGFWGSDEWDWAFDFEYLSPDRHRLIPALLRKAEVIGQEPTRAVAHIDDYFESMITFHSGDELVIACKSIIM